MRLKQYLWLGALGAFLWATAVGSAHAEVYEVGPGRPFANIGDVPWESLAAGDTVLIHWREAPYHEKWVVGRQGTEKLPILISGVPGPKGELPVIDGRNATTRPQLNYWGEARNVIKVGGSNSPPDTTPAYVVIENLEVRSARRPHTFTGRAGLTAYAVNAAAIQIEKGENITIRNCTLADSGNGLFISPETRGVLVEGSYIYGNGNVGDIYTHNVYTEANGITFQFNRLGPLLPGAGGNNLKDRSAGTVIRFNWVEGGNRQLDLVDSEVWYADPAYRTTLVYGNILIEPGNDGNRQMIHYGGDGGRTAVYRKGTLHFYNNTVISRRTSLTVLMRLSTQDEQADVRNNVLYVTGPGNQLGILETAGTARLTSNWLKPGWTRGVGSVTVEDLGGQVLGASPGFVDEAAGDFNLAPGSPCRDVAAAPHPEVIEWHPPFAEYWVHQAGLLRPDDGRLDIGAFEGR